VASHEDAKPLIIEILRELRLEPSGYDVIIGSDEAGKGEWLGPLTVAAVALSPEGMLTLRAEGVMDSKELESRRILEIAEKIKQTSIAFHVVTITPRRFNKLLKELWEEDRNLNDLLAWAHARAIETVYRIIKEKEKEKDEATIMILIDEFDRLKTEERLRRILELRSIKVLQSPDAEEIVAVAAAGILAKAACEAWIDRESARLSFDLRKIPPMEASKMKNREAYFKISYLHKILDR
jgi:ribonuclease HIII